MPVDLLHALTLGDIIRENRRSYPQRIAVVDGDLRLTWPEFDDRVNQLANALRDDAGVGEGDRVLWLGQNSFRVLEGLLAAAKLGAIFCPANWRQSADEFAFVIDDTRAKVAIWQEEEIGEAVLAARDLAETGNDGLWLRHDSGEYDAFVARGSIEDPDLVIDPALPGAAALHRRVQRTSERRAALALGRARAGPRHGQPATRRQRLRVPEQRPALSRRHVHDHAGHVPLRRHQRVHAARRCRGAVPAHRRRALHRRVRDGADHHADARGEQGRSLRPVDVCARSRASPSGTRW